MHRETSGCSEAAGLTSKGGQLGVCEPYIKRILKGVKTSENGTHGRNGKNLELGD